MRTIAIHLGLLAAFASVSGAQTCFQIHGRAVLYRGDGFFAIWHVGTHHIFFPDAKSSDLICQYFDCESGDRQPALFADFTICPTKPYISGAAQAATVTAVQHPRVVPDWPAPGSARAYVKDFYDWYVPRALKDDSDWQQTLKLAHWDLSPQLARLLEDDAAAQAQCKEIVGIDFDPLLNTQDPSEHYQFGAPKRIGDRYNVEIYRVEENKPADKPDLIAVVARDGDRWYFVNFLFPSENTDLLTILKSPKPTCTVPREKAKQ
jgi:hypothetical protein